MYSPFSEASEKPRALFASDARATQSPATPTHAARQRPRKSLVFMGITSVLVHFRSRSTRPSLPRVVGRGNCKGRRAVVEGLREAGGERPGSEIGRSVNSRMAPGP